MAKDRKIDMVILGFLTHENLSGYEIKKQIDNGISFFWKGSFGSIYPSLSAMETEGFVHKLPIEENSQKREKIKYEITEEGRNVLLSWLQDCMASNDLKYETLLKVFFGGVANPEVTIRNIEAFEREAEGSLNVLKIYERNLSKVLNQKEHVYYYLTVTFGIETYEGYLRWCTQAKKMLQDAK